MFSEEINKVSTVAKGKLQFLKNNPLGYFLSSCLAGLYVGLGTMLIFTVGGLLSSGGSQGTKIVMGISFGIALSLVIFAGSELFTGNNFVMSIGFLKKEVTLLGAAKVWVGSYVGNLVGSVLGAFIYYYSGTYKGVVGEFIIATSATKMGLPIGELIFRGILCNILVCLAVWCSIKMKEEIAKLVVIFWCLFAFITSGFEHSVANMTLLAIGLLVPHGIDVTLGGYAYNLFYVTIGNFIGGAIFLAVPYYIISRKK